jgi:Flp pilus assembly protein TadG
MTHTVKQLSGRPRRGAVALLFALFLVVMMGMVACALDIGWILMTRTQLQAAADSAALAGGTELMPGLGYLPSKTPSEVEAAVRPVATAYAAEHPNGEVAATFADATRDVDLGWATFDSDSGSWTFSTSGDPTNGWYNAVRVTLRRDQEDSSEDDSPLPLIIAPILDQRIKRLAATATAVILPASGFRIEPGSNETLNLMPFALIDDLWEKYMRAQQYYNLNPTVFSGENYLALLQTITDPPGMDLAANPDAPRLFGHYLPTQEGNAADRSDGVTDGRQFIQDFFDTWTCGTCPDGGPNDPSDPTILAGPDGYLELDAYPRDEATSGNFGTVDFGSANNATPDIERQIDFGISEDDLLDMGFNAGDVITLDGLNASGNGGVDGETGVSAGFKDALDRNLGQCRVIALYSSVAAPGDNATFTLSGWAGIRIMDVQLTGSLEIKNLTLQFCNAVGTGAVADITEEIGEHTTVFTPLILIE